MPSLDWNNVFKNLSFLSGNRQPTEMRQRDRGESETEVEKLLRYDKSKYFLFNYVKFLEKWIIEFCTFVICLQYWENLPYDFHSSVHWEGTVRFISHTTTAHHKKFKQFLTKIINGNLVRLVRVISFLQRKKKIESSISIKARLGKPSAANIYLLNMRFTLLSSELKHKLEIIHKYNKVKNQLEKKLGPKINVCGWTQNIGCANLRRTSF